MASERARNFDSPAPIPDIIPTRVGPGDGQFVPGGGAMFGGVGGHDVKMGEMLKAMLTQQAFMESRGQLPPTPNGAAMGSLLGLSSRADEGMVDRSRPIGPVRRMLLTPDEHAAIADSMGGDATPRGDELIARLGIGGPGLQASPRIVMAERRLASGCWECVVSDASFDTVYLGQAVPIHMIPRAEPPAPGSSPAPAAAAAAAAGSGPSPGPDSIS